MRRRGGESFDPGRRARGCGACQAHFFEQRWRQAAEVRLELGDDRRVRNILGLDRMDERNLRFEETSDVSVERSFRVEILDGDPLRLTQAVAAVFGLRVISRDPSRS